MVGEPHSQVGAYRLLRLLSAGGEASVFEAEDSRLGRRVAVKLRPLSTDKPERAAQLNEARTLATLAHPLIMQVHDVVELPDALALVLELVRGRDLASLLEATELGPGMVVHIGLDLCSALAAAHDAGVVHGDLKAANILVTRDGHIKLFDFGLAHRGAASRAGGSAVCLSPEQLRGEPVDHRSDLFALGCLLYRLLDGDYPFPVGGGDWQRQRLETVPEAPRGADGELATLVLSLLSGNPERRPGSVRAVRQRLLALSRDLPAGDAAALARLTSQVEQARRARPLSAYGPERPVPAAPVRRRATLALALAALALLGTALYPVARVDAKVPVRIEGVYVSGNSGLSAERLEAMLQQLIEVDARLLPVADGEASMLALHVSCATEVCSTQLVLRQGALELADTRSLLASDSELGWKRRLAQGLRELFPH